MSNKLKVLFAGTADFSAGFLDGILEAGNHEVVAVVTQPDKVTGRGKKVQMTKVKEIAVAHEIPVYQFTSSLRHPENYQELLKLDFDLMVVVAFGDILPVELIHAPKYQSINVHPSLLPLGRGASPVQNTILKGDDKTAFCIIKMDETLDTGDILLWQDVAVSATETSESLFAKLLVEGKPLLNKVLDNIEHYLANAQPQAPLVVENPKKTYTRKIKKTAGKFKPELTAITLERKLRAFDIWPGLYLENEQNPGQDIKFISAKAYPDFASLAQAKPSLAQLQLKAGVEYGNNASLAEVIAGSVIATSKQAFYILCGEGSILEVSSIQLPGKKPMDFASVRNGYPDLFTVNTLLK